DGAEDGRIVFSGPSITLDPQPTLHLALVLHELGTNARKYGSLSVPDGCLTVTWTVRSSGERRLLLQWRESGGPPVQVPSARGFGTTLIERSLAAHGGEVSIQYNATGLSCDISLPISESATKPIQHAVDAAVSAAEVVAPAESRSSIDGQRVLVVED